MSDIVRLCPGCQSLVTRADEKRGFCPKCGAILLTLAGEKGQAAILLVLVFIVLMAAVFCAISGAAIMTDPDGNTIIGRPADFANATAIAKGADLARQSTQVAVNSEATRSAAGSQATATAAAVAVAATSTAIAQVANATATAAPHQANLAAANAQSAAVGVWVSALAGLVLLCVCGLLGLGVVGIVNKRATSLYPNAAGQYPIKIERHGNVLTMHDPNRGLGPTAIYVAPGLIERATWAITTLRGAQLPPPQPGTFFPQPGSEGAMLQLASQAQAGQVAAAQNKWPMLPQNVAGQMTLAGGSGLTAAAMDLPHRLPPMRLVDDPQRVDAFVRLLEAGE